MGTNPNIVLQCSRIAMELFWLVWVTTTAKEPAAMNITPTEIIFASWCLFATYWLFAALGAKRPAKKESGGERFLHVAVMTLGFFMFYGDAFRFGVLNRRFLPDELWIAWAGAALTLVGVLFAIWARFTIGNEWSAEVQIKEGHQLIRSGPYAHIRHPIYTGILLALCGTSITIGEYRAILGLALLLFGFIRKAKKEERFLAGEFGPAFDEHRRHTGFFLPRFT
ncbi:MAG: isoprenylcysteine carboxylmethyltransferase family protein [Candidatus Acidiferrales bacterium]